MTTDEPRTTVTGATSLRRAIEATRESGPRYLRGRAADADLSRFLCASSLGTDRTALAGQSVLVLTEDQLTAAAAMIELDGLAARMLLCPPDIRADHLNELCAHAEITALVYAGPAGGLAIPAMPLRVPLLPAAANAASAGGGDFDAMAIADLRDDGRPKIVTHTFASLTAAIAPASGTAPVPVWSTFYDIRRYGGLQIFLRAVTGRGSMVLSDPQEPVSEFLARLARHAATHVSERRRIGGVR